MTPKSAPGVAAVNRALSILMAFEHSIEGLTVAEISQITGLYHSTILRLSESLLNYGFLVRLDDGRFRLGSTPMFLGMLYQSSFRLWDYAAPVLRKLVNDTRETAAIYIRDGDSRVCLHRMTQPRGVLMHVREGERVELDKGAAGKVLLAFSGQPGEIYDKIRNAHYALSMGERGGESIGLACPVFGIQQKVLCSISLGMPIFRMNRQIFEASLPLVMQAAATLTQQLGGDATVFEPPYTPLEGVTLPEKTNNP
ncbi:IclR family transcriptional regulator [Orrella sp. 11846]|uniref:IclR family transcriptional regulator n=1 Tax=Orrella sp. 11846 TaxID=3409913 RepID=UPI003B5C5FBA